MSVAQQARIFDLGAKDTRARILHDRRIGLEPAEETLTQNFASNYLARVRKAGLRARVREFTKWQEAHLVGADLALWFHDGSGNFAGIYLQAKRLFPDGTYRGLNHGSGRQHATLVSGAGRDGVLAGYAFYNGLDDPEPWRSACGHGIGATDSSGITVASALALIPHLKGRVPRTQIEQLCSPLSCLVRHAHSTTSGGPGATGPGGPGAGGAGSDGSGSRGSGPRVTPFGASGGDGTSPSTSHELPAALLQFAEHWSGSEAKVHTEDTLPDYARAIVKSDSDDRQADEPLYPWINRDRRLPYDSDDVVDDRGDLSLTTTVLMIGPR